MNTEFGTSLPQKPNASANGGAAKWIVAALLLLSIIPLAGGAFRLTQLAGGAAITPANARFFAAPVPVVLHIVSVSLYAILGAFQFVPSLRRRRHAWHRAAGWLLIPCGLMVALSGLWMTLFSQYEIGSLTKTFTALLLTDAIRRGEVTADTKVGTLLPLDGAPIADVTLAELASHRSGLSAQGMQLDDTIPFLLRYVRHHDPFTQDLDGVLAIARKATLTNRGGIVYSI